MQGTQQLAHVYQVKTRQMTQILRYRQYWMATLKRRHCCQMCGDLAINAESFELDNGVLDNVNWFCDEHSEHNDEKDTVGSS
jgi:hypothetical protein